MLWLRSTATDNLAPIDLMPAPGGNVVVHRDGLGQPIGTYDVVTPPRPARTPRPAPQPDALLDLDGDLGRSETYADLGGGLDDLDGADEPDDALVPTRHVNHWSTCSSATARRLARERAATGGPPRPLRTVDGDPVGPRHLTERNVDVLGPPADQAVRRCRGCFEPLNSAMAAAGERWHATCGPDPGPEPDRP